MGGPKLLVCRCALATTLKCHSGYAEAAWDQDVSYAGVDRLHKHNLSNAVSVMESMARENVVEEKCHEGHWADHA
eukprot:6489751-Amphidinium_carterae.1